MAPTYSQLPTDEESPPPPKPAARQPTSYRRIFALALGLLVVAFASYKFGQWSVRPSAVDSALPTSNTSTPLDNTPFNNTTKPNTTEPVMHDKGKVSFGYFVNWGIYGRKYPPQKIPTEDLTHILYSFANLKPDTGEVYLSDDWADKDIHYPGDSWNDPGTNLYGNFKAIYKLKKQHRHLKVLLSIGGWTYSPHFHPVVVNPALRARFVSSSVRLLEDYGLDGLDVDYEYPSNDEQARGYVALLRELRTALDQHARAKNANYKFLLTIAAPCGPDNYKKLHIAEMDRYLDFWNMMAYDFSGSWDQIANHQANLFGAPLSASQAIHHYISSGVPRSKIVLGIPLYGRSFASTQGPGTPFAGVGGGSWEQGVYDYRALPMPGAHVLRDERLGASWTYDYQKREMVSYDSEEVGRWKGEWIRKEALSGSMFWELSGDKGSEREGMEGGLGKEAQPGKSLVKVVKDAMGGLRMEENWLRYEGSKYDNMRNGME
ncbi:putative glycosyl hydrolase 18 family protein [Lyophyllum shimeji]|uniref:chitinase n=1 Tax=Lyophyllum shimeji TaxID=47721 RepID=A0A9P3PIZ5_LYOSH|nr:putative glycosyl hydrolase 18 family protein [Lyophyllum shimeji]